MVWNANWVFGLLGLLAVALAIGFPAHADECKDVLARTEISRLDTTAKKLAFLQTIQTSEEWEDAKKISGGLKTVIEEIPLEATNDYSAFQDWRKSYLSHFEFNMQDDELHRLTASFLPPDLGEFWLQCMLRDTGGGLPWLSPMSARMG